MKEFQSYNSRIKKWVKYTKLENGQTRITKTSSTPFENVPKKTK